jgi:hypothetical protein
MRLVTVSVLSLFAMSALAGKINLQTRYVETSYTVHTLTGLTSDEKSRDVVRRSELEVTKVTKDGVEYLSFKSLNKSGSSDTDEQEASIDIAKKQALVDALNMLKEKIRLQDRKAEDVTESLFKDGDLELTSIRVMKPKKVTFELTVGTCIYIINDESDQRKILGLLAGISPSAPIKAK